VADDIFIGPPKPAQVQAAAFKTPPAAKPLPGVTGQMPIPSGRMLSHGELTEGELADLQKVGWKPGDQIPVEMAQMIEYLQEQAREETKLENLQPPVPLDTPALEISEPVDLADVSAEKRASLLKFLADAKQNAKQIVEFDAGPAAGAGVADAVAGRNVLQLDDDRPEAAPAAETPRNDLGLGGLTITNCPHCSWQLDVADIPDPTDVERQAYLQAVLGQVPFEKVYSLFGGHVQLTLRELRPREVDAIYLAASRGVTQDDSSDAMRAAKFMEWVDRYRLALQMTRLRIGDKPMTFPGKLVDWRTADGQDDAALANAAADVIFSEVVTSESLGRALMLALGEFCRLVAKLEVAADRPDFWTAASSV
jgi:hypothetical protein